MAGGIYPYELADGSTRYRAVYRTSNGVQRQKRGFTSSRAADRWLTATRAAVHRGEVIASSGTFAQRFDQWLAEHRPHIEEGTYLDYRTHGDKRLKPFFGEFKPDVINRADVRRYVGELAQSKTVAVKTINNSLVVLRLFLGQLVEDGVIARNPAASRPGSRERIKLPDAHREMDYLRLEEIPRYLDACEWWYRPLAEVLIACGLRISEALALQWGDVDWASRTLRIQRSVKRSGIGSTKGDRSRAVDFGPRVESILKAHRIMQANQGLDVSPARLVFRGPRGGELSRSDISRDIHKAVLEDAALRTTVRLHDLRHTAAASWLAAGLPLIYVQRQLGHASIDTTQRVYGHLEESFLRGAAERAEQHLWAPKARAGDPLGDMDAA